MKKSLFLTYGLLLLLTVATALISILNIISIVVVSLIMGISAIKFLLVAFQFMELKKANVFWKSSLIFVLTLIISIVILLQF